MPIYTLMWKLPTLPVLHIAIYAMKNAHGGQDLCANAGNHYIPNMIPRKEIVMELIKEIIEEFRLREKGKRGKLENISDLQLICLAYKLGIKPVG